MTWQSSIAARSQWTALVVATLAGCVPPPRPSLPELDGLFSPRGGSSDGSRARSFGPSNAGTVVLIDMNAAGRFAETAALTIGVQPVAAEQAVSDTPRDIAGHFYAVSAIGLLGTAPGFRRSSRTAAVASDR